MRLSFYGMLWLSLLVAWPHARAQEVPESEPVPPVAPMEPSVVCAACGEKVMETHARLRRGRVLCEACFETEMPRK